jgi:hypothetical protein
MLKVSAICRLAAMMGVEISEAAKFITPIVKFDDRIERLRSWAEGKTIPASSEQSSGHRNISLN